MSERQYTFNINEGEIISASLPETEIIDMIHDGRLMGIDKLFFQNNMGYRRIDASDLKEYLPKTTYPLSLFRQREVEHYLSGKLPAQLLALLRQYTNDLYQYIERRHRIEPRYVPEQFRTECTLTGPRAMAGYPEPVDVLDLILTSRYLPETWIYRRQFYLTGNPDTHDVHRMYQGIMMAPHLSAH